jgi:hypothetical protein
MSNTMLCPSCQQSIPKESHFCPTCGYSFPEKQESPETEKCPNCGTSYEIPVSMFCGSCGYELSQPELAPLFTPIFQPDFEDRANNISENPPANDDGESEESHSGKNTYLTSAAILGILLAIGIVLVGMVALLQKNSATSRNPNPTPNMGAVYTAAWETALVSVEQASVPTFTAIPSPTWTPTPTPSLIPTAVPMITAQKEAEDFIYFYWGLIDKKDFDTAWLYQSTSFRKNFNGDNFDSFVSGFQYTKNVIVLRAETINIDDYSATVDADIQFITIDNQKSAIASHRYTLVKQDNQWALETAVKMSANAASTTSACAGARGGRLHTGDTARIIVFQLSIRDAPGGEQYGQRLNVLAQGQEVTIVEEPVCMTGMYFVKIQSKVIDEVGWVAEGDSTDYYLEPVK